MYPSAERRVRCSEPFRVDARAEGQEIGVGGWLPTRGLDGQPGTRHSPWFALTLDAVTAPWAYARGDPYRAIAALEAMGALLAIVAFTSPVPAASDVSLQFPGLTDNRGNHFVLSKLMTTKFPLCGVVMELAMQMEARNLKVDFNWLPRDLNQEADDLSNGLTDAFEPSLRVDLDVSRIRWLALDRIMAAGADFEAHRREAKTGDVPGTRRGKRGKQERLRVTHPW